MANKEPGEVVEKARMLLKLAADDPESEESRTAAVKVVLMMKENDLVLVPRDVIEASLRKVGEATALAQKAEQEKIQNMLIGAGIGFFVGGGKFGK
jgi:hypothetical protein